MTVVSSVSRVSYPGPGAGPFAFTFKISQLADLRVMRVTAGVPTVLTNITDYTVTPAPTTFDPFGNGGSITLTVALTNADTLVIRRAPNYVQPSSFGNHGKFFPKDFEDSDDYLAMQIQALADDTSRAIKLDDSIDPVGGGFTTALPSPSPNLFLGWDSSGKRIINTPGIPGPAGPAIPVVADAAARSAAFPIPAPNQLVEQLDVGYFMRFDSPSSTWRPEAKARNAGPEISVVALGADPTGVIDCSSVLATAKSLANTSKGIIDFDPGTYLVSSTTDFTGFTHRFAPGVTIKRGLNATITFGRIVAGNYKIIDASVTGGTGAYVLSYNPANHTDEFNGRWTGIVADGVTNDSGALNLATDMCIGPAGNGSRYGNTFSYKNRPLMLPAGIISVQVNGWNISGSVGWKVRSQGRLATKISFDTANMIGVIGDAASYGHFEDIIFQTTQNQDSTHPLLDIDYTGTYSGANGISYLKPQQWTFERCYFNSSLDNIHFAAIGLAWCRTGGGSAQGDTVLFPNSLFSGFTFSGFTIGSLTVQAQNALDINVLGGDFQNHPLWSIFNNGGDIRCWGTGFQNQFKTGGFPYLDASNNPTSFALATHVGNINQIDTGGGDVWANWSGGCRSAIVNCRSESFVLCRGSGVGRIDNCRIMAGGIGAWQANSAYPQGFPVRPSGVATASGFNGGAWVVFNATPTPGSLTSGGAEPDWASKKFGYVEEGLSVTNGQTVVGVRAPIRLTNPVFDTTWGAIVVDNTGVNQKFYTTIDAATISTNITLHAAIPWTSASVTIHIGPLITDNGLTWMPYNYIALEGEFEFVNSLELNFGQIKPLLSFPQFLHGRVSRWDCFWEPTSSFFSAATLAYSSGEWDLRVGPSTATDSNFPLVPNSPLFLQGSAINVRNYTPTARKNFNVPVFFDQGWGGENKGSVGIGRLSGSGPGSGAAPGNDNDLTYNAVGIIGGSLAGMPAGWPTTLCDSSGPTPNGPSNTAGGDLNVGGGPGTGNQPSGRVAFRTGLAGTSGTQFNNTREVGNFDTTGRLNSKFGRSVSAVSGVIVIAAAGSATPNPDVVEVSRYQINGAATFNDPVPTSAFVDGQVWTLEIFNNTAGSILPTMGGTKILGGFNSIGAGKWQTRRYIYDATISKWKPTGGWSPDL